VDLALVHARFEALLVEQLGDFLDRGSPRIRASGSLARR
jgi:hypothetical protein